MLTIKPVLRLNRWILGALTGFVVLKQCSGNFFGFWWLSLLFIGLLGGVGILNEGLLRFAKRSEHSLQSLSGIIITLQMALGGLGLGWMLVSGLWGAGLIAGVVGLELLWLAVEPLKRLMAWTLLALTFTVIASTLSGLKLTLGLGLEALPAFILLGLYIQLLTESTEQQAHKIEKLQAMATTDALTGLMNRRQFNQRLTNEMARARRHHTPLSLALFDIDNFKRLNDFYGHPTGDRILRELGQLMQNNVREHDIAARYGGEEFALILPETRVSKAVDLLERLRLLVERHVFCLPDNPLTMTLSIGVAQFDLKNQTSFEFVENTDTALYDAKHQGKNRVISAASPEMLAGV